MTKAEARRIARANVARMSDEQKEWASGCIVDALSGTAQFNCAHRPFIYLGTSSEPATDELVGLALMLEREVCVPRVSGKDMYAVMITPYTLFKTNKWGILEPVGGHEVEDADVAVIPLVAFDGLNRVGHGGGYYDRYLESKDIFKIGIAFDCQQVTGIETEQFDVGLDMLVTERRIIDAYGEKENEFFCADK